MKEFLKQLLSDDTGIASSQRLIFVIGSFYSMGMGLLVYIMSKDWVASITTTSTLSAVFGAQKLLQKTIEK
jgi:hypothetical protein